MKKRTTLKQIAKVFNVSIATVSKALKDSHEISVATKNKIQEYAKNNNYRPNSIALSLLNRKTKTIGVIMPSILNPFFVKIFSGIEHIANDKGYNVITIVSHGKLEKEITSIHMLENGLIDGLLISLSEETEAKQHFGHLEEFIDNAGPIVMFDRISDSVNTDKVIVDDFNCAYKATEHLIKTGCKHISVVSTLDNVGIIKLRIDGYLKALENYNIPINEKIINLIKPGYDFETEIKTMLDYQKVDAIIGLEEFSAVESMVIAQDRGYTIPDDISIISFTNSDFFKYTKPSITCINQHSVFMGKTATEILISKIEQPPNTESVFETKTIKTTLVERKSTKPLVHTY
ncbi:LacI family DNA-binding transcriptional regulator [Formosa algae]|uniref:LacI family transcriptional regulator n=2 Tax=Formosa algae TaxID=225843 RepID=A0A9X0YI17_9FLAO|nr:LacI family DNA-binding transcriptional regulator [Formosa algae]MBP1838721.1 LacI family transcriptional regulator [Formosa algae]MDQ0335221.1 LacI family transcriptional regulator [Formosa algae]OEI81655.1 LacI family transcriptional regulator [Formosa algae]